MIIQAQNKGCKWTMKVVQDTKTIDLKTWNAQK
jgi:hypothetical protein